MSPNSTDLKIALRENLKLRRELATEVADAKGDKFALFRLRVAKITTSVRYGLLRRIRPTFESRTVVQPHPVKTATVAEDVREKPTQHLRQLDSQTDSGECRQRALECVRLSQTTIEPEAKQVWSDLARTWLMFATDIEANKCLLDEWGKPRPKGQKTL